MTKRRVSTNYSLWLKKKILGESIGQLVGGLQPLLDITKELQDSDTRYKSFRTHLLRDVLTPVRAIGNVLAGILTIAAIVPLTIVSTWNAIVDFVDSVVYYGLYYPLLEFYDSPTEILNSALKDPVGFVITWVNDAIISPVTNLGNDTIKTLVEPISYALDGIGRIGLGLIQAAKTIAMPLIMSIRTLHTMARGIPIANESNALQESCNDLKIVVAQDRGQTTVLSNGIKSENGMYQGDYMDILHRFCRQIDKAKAQGRTLNLKTGNDHKKYVDMIDDFMKDDKSTSFRDFYSIWQKQSDNEVHEDKFLAKTIACIVSPAA